MATDNKLFFSNLKKLFSTGTIVRQIGKKQLVVKDLDSRQANLSRRLYDRYNRLFHSQYTTKSYLSGWRPGQTVDRRMRYFDYECIAGNTIISTPAGNFTIEELSKIYPDKYTKFIVYSYDTKNQKIVFGTAHSARKTKTDMTYKVKLSKNKEIIATADHPILMKNEEYKTIGELKVNDEVMSFDKNVYQYKVVSVKPHKVIDVYDISVNEYHNFATDSIFVHNCMDADPLCSSVLDVYAEEAGLEDETGELLNITSDNENITEILHNLFYDIINLEFNFFPWVRNLPVKYDTIIPLLDGSEVTIKELSEKLDKNPNEEIWIYSIQDKTNKIVPGKVKWCQLTRKNSKMLKIWLDDNTFIETSPDHEFILRDGSKKRADELLINDSLMPFYTQISTEKDFAAGYEKVYNPSSNYYKFTHKIVSQELLRGAEPNIATDPIQTHHINFNKLNNNPINLKRLSKSEHIKFHGELGKRILSRPDVVEKRRIGIHRWLISNKHKKMLSEKQKGIYPKQFKQYNNSAEHDTHNEIRCKSMKLAWQMGKIKNRSKLKINTSCIEYVKKYIQALNHYITIADLINALKIDNEFLNLYKQSNKNNTYNITKTFNANTFQTILKREYGQKYRQFITKCIPGVQTNPKWIKKYQYLGIKFENHKVSKIEKTIEADAYCMEIIGPNNLQDRHNFAICSKNIDNKKHNRNGIFVSNCKYGDMFLALEISPEYGIINVYPFSVYEIEREEGVDEKNPDAVRFILMGNRQESLENYEVIHFRLLSDTILLPYGRSILEPGRRIWKQLQLMEDAMLIYRIMRAPERRIFYINVGNLAADDIDNFMQKAISKVKKTPVIDSSTGEFNLRYNVMPVKWDTKIPLLDGRSITIKQLSEEYNSGKENWVYSIDRENNNKIVPGKVTWCGLTRPDAKLIRVTLDDDGYVDMTPDHPVMLRDGNYIEAQQLKVNDSIMPFYTKLSIEPGIKNYEKIYDPSNNEYEFTHRIVSRELNIDNYNNTKNIVHHQNFVRLDNSPGNLNCSMNAADHIRYHVNNAKGRKKPEHSKWMKENYIPYIRTPEQCENISKRMTGKNNPNYGKSVSAYTRSKLSASIKKTKRSETFKKKYNEIFTAEYRKLIGEKSTINNKERWANEKFRNHICFAMKDKFDDYLFNKMIQYITINPDTNLDNLTTLMNSNPELYGHYIEINMNRMKPKQFQKHVLQRSIRKRLGLTYREFKKEIQNNQILNHKVKSIENIENSDAYCMTVDKYHNFATDTYNSNTRSGIFVKNSIAEDFFFPVRGGEDNPTKVETLPGGQNTGDIEDVTYLLSKLFSAFKVPKSFLQYESDVSAKSTLAIEDIRFSRSVERVQKIIEAELTKIAIIHLYSQGFRNEDLINFDLKLTRSSTLREQQKLDLLDKKVSMTKSCRESESLSMKWIYETVWEFSEDEIKDIEDEIINDKKTMFRMAQIQDGGNDPAITNKVVDTSNTASDNNSASSGSKEDTSTKSADKEVGFDWNDEKDSNKEERNSNVGFDNKRVTGYAPTISAAYLSNIAKKFNITDKNIRTSNGMNLLSEGYGEKLIDKIDGILENSKLL